MDKIANPIAPGAGSPPPELVGRDVYSLTSCVGSLAVREFTA